MGSQISTANAINSISKQLDSQDVHPRVLSAIQSAASKTGVDFSYLMQKASQESSFDPTAKATTSSATGLFQFTSQTWLHMIKTYGDEYGLEDFAAQIDEDANGKLSVDDPVMRQAILALRKDPQVSAEMAGELDKENAAALQRKVGGKIGKTELYLAHFLGAGGASKFIRQMRANPNVAAAEIMPSAASANPSVFYSKTGEARSVQQIYQRFAQKFDAGSTQIASASTGTSAISSVASGLYAGAVSKNIAAYLPTNTAASPSAEEEISRWSKDATLASLGTGSTLFNAMVFGQVQDAQLNSASALSAFNHHADGKKKDTLGASYVG